MWRLRWSARSVEPAVQHVADRLRSVRRRLRLAWLQFPGGALVPCPAVKLGQATCQLHRIYTDDGR